jgi:phosphomannomutase/phosphoglucomutase
MNIKFSTTGIRGISNETMTAELALELGKTFGSFMKGKGAVLVARDTRTSSEMLSSALISGLLSTGVNVTDAGVAPIPALSNTVKQNFDAGIMVTSSHNPPEYNGVKFILGDGVEISEADEQKFIELYKAEKIQVAWDKIGSLTEKNILDSYSENLIKSIDSTAVKEKKFTVALDTGNGAQSVLMPDLLEKLGCNVIGVHIEPKGIFERPSEPKQETLGDLINIVKEKNADLGIAFDCDGDRCIFVSDLGEVLMVDVTGSIFARGLLRENNGGKIVTTVATSKIIDDIAEKENGEVIKTKVGAKYVGETLMKESALYGFEENGGNIFPDVSYTRDGSATAVKLLDVLSKTNKKLSEFVSELPKYYQVKVTVSCPDDKTGDISKIKELIDRETEEIITIDGIKIMFSDGSVIMRASGTEPLIRIFAEATSEEKAEEYSKWGTQLVKKIL